MEVRMLQDLLAEYRHDRERMQYAPPKVRARYDLVMALLEEAIERRMDVPVAAT